MERDIICIMEDDPPQSQTSLNSQNNTLLCSNLFLDNVGEVVLTLQSDGLSWKSNHIQDESSCMRANLSSDIPTVIKISDIYAIQFIDWGTVHESPLASAGGCFLGHSSEMYRFSVHGIQKSKTHPSLLSTKVYTFGHNDLRTCQAWIRQIDAILEIEADRPKNLLVFVHPRSGKGDGYKNWLVVAPIFRLANVKTKVIITERAGHAFDVVASIASKELYSYDGVVAVGGDGLFNELLNGLLLFRRKVSQPSEPAEFSTPVGNSGSVSVHETDDNVAKSYDVWEDHSPLLKSSGPNGSGGLNLRFEGEFCRTDMVSTEMSSQKVKNIGGWALNAMISRVQKCFFNTGRMRQKWHILKLNTKKQAQILREVAGCIG